jgi:dipeptidase E
LRRIIAIGGGAFSARKPRPAFDRWLLAQTGKRRPRVCFIPTASGDAVENVRRVERVVRRLGGRPLTLSLFAAPTENLTHLLCRHDLVFVGGGNTYNMLALWRLWKLDAALRRAYERGVIMSGTSAGALCWFGSGLTDSFPGRFDRMTCLGWLRGSFTPHFDGERGRQAVYRRLIRAGKLPGGYAVDDLVAIEFRDGRFARAASASRTAGARHIRRNGRRLVETALAVERIG